MSQVGNLNFEMEP